ncbi:MAG: DUF4070 domain-containing protein [Actinomycetota bacterium]|nr:DUF4070 domain-containing protein [Actinomycetota bacterium]
MNKKILMVYPQYDETFWSFKKVLNIINKKSAFPPLGLLTVSAMLPPEWEKKILDLNFQQLTDQDILWADYVFVSAMIVQKKSSDQVIQMVQQLGKPVVAGGPLFTTGWEHYTHVDHLFIGESEETLGQFVNDVEKGTLKPRYECQSFPDITTSPIPDWTQIDITKYNSLCIQFSRGCPFNCEFCDIVKLNGRVPRTKTSQQVLDELETIYNLGYRGGIFFVDDNFIGNKGKLKKEHLPAMINWQKKKNFPFSFNTQVSINLADDQELMKLMAEAGFTAVFVGIETPDPAGLEECSKYQNQNRDLIDSVKTLQKEGFEVQGGFIVGFDSDTPSIFQSQIDFIQKSGIVTAMVGVLTALPKTRLYQRLQETKRLLGDTAANNTNAISLNFIPKMGKQALLDGYKKIVDNIYAPKQYYERIKTFIINYKPPKRGLQKLRLYHIKAFFASIWLLGVKDAGRRHFWNLMAWSLFKHPNKLAYAIGFSLTGIHFRSVFA